MAKSDLKSAFKILPIKPCQRNLLIMKCRSPMDGKMMYFMEKCLPFGASISCVRFQLFSDSLKALVEFTMWCHPVVTNYLDDFMFVSHEEEDCNHLMKCFMEICAHIGCPISEEKPEWASTDMVFLGILINGISHTLSIPEAKRITALGMIEWALAKKKVTIRFIQQLTATLNFINRAIVPGRAFRRGMYAKLKLRDRENKLLKQYHHVTLGHSFKEDCRIWKIFLENATAVELCQPFIDLAQSIEATTLNFYSDASLNKVSGGLRVIFGNSWIKETWGADFITEAVPSIEFLELFALVAAMLTWGDRLTNTRVIIFCDNQAVLHIVNSLVSSCAQCMKLIRMLTLNNLQFNRRVFIKYVRLKDNVLSDALSRDDMVRFWKHAPVSMSKSKSSLSKQIWPVEKIWYDGEDSKIKQRELE